MDRSVRRGVRARLDPSLVQQSIDTLTERAPSDRIRATERGWVVRDEVPWFVLFFAVALFSLAAIAHAGVARAPRFPHSFRVLPWLFDLGWVACVWLFARQLWGALSISLDGDTLRIERLFRERPVKSHSIDPEDVLAVRVADERTVSIEGPQNQKALTVFTAGPLDPPTLPKWIADCVVALCERAQSR